MLDAEVMDALSELHLTDLAQDVVELLGRIQTNYRVIRIGTAIYLAARLKGFYVPEENIRKVLGIDRRKRFSNSIKRTIKRLELQLPIPNVEACAKYVARVISNKFVLDEQEVFSKIVELAKKMDTSASPLVKVVAATYLVLASFRINVTQKMLSDLFPVSDAAIRYTLKNSFNCRAVELKKVVSYDLL